MMLSTFVCVCALAVSAPAKLKTMDTVIGSGTEAKKGDVVTLSYKGWLQSDGVVFDKSEGGAPIALRLGAKQVIKGWEEGIPGMKVGGRRMLLIPPEMAYGKESRGPIPANSTLVFEVELLRVDKKDAKPEIEIKEIKEGEGEAVKVGDIVELHYVGTFLNGEKFDSSKDRNQTFTVKAGVGMVIKGFDQGLLGMKKGGVRTITIPYQLAYGDRGAGPIPPMSALAFELEIVKITSDEPETK